ncbi:MAG: adenylyltransferase/cytidyltransferase family protein [Lachnospiraceae bacterium]|nr:adenylyltransferase/cytidyltransferase family protein [Lachnospiraceae bacterium]MDE7204832.1 adenylyltransferase/cytidyltransferase family protein [Lachnospiraceae bacterium]
MGINNFSIYDPNLTYVRPKPVFPKIGNDGVSEKKKYNVGYVAGVFDLFHIGHLNLLKRAKEQCNYLIVGVVTDEGVIQKKRSTPFVPFSERIELVRSCKYVDEAVEIPFEYYDTDEAYRRYQFDVQFSGSDYADSEGWLAKKEYLRKHGSDLIFFPYTQSTSSTRIKELISRKLI